ncbi:MAG: elongation factor P maturation arginine rhamnosyltransferase EarP, partial [Sideroxyarcus sp.]|nr:elongation factor P maturation arginine rhamnosyltransferase EarP [Sideroxyarcus sp.]
HQQGVEVRRWPAEFPPVEPAALVIEAFACRLPQRYLAAMAARDKKPVWVNLEYLSAEDWVEGCHKLPSPHPTLPLTKYYFFPGFTEKTGGLLLERDLLTRRDVFQSDTAAQAVYWHGLGVPERARDELRVSLFSYENEAMAELLHAWEHGAQLITCLVPEGRALPQVQQYFGNAGRASARQIGLKPDLQVYARGNLHVQVLPFVEQDRYDELLWACDINFVRGEDSCVRAQWAARPFIWHIYPQHDGVHLAKLEALRARYAAGLPADAAAAVRAMWAAWNGGTEIGAAWLSLLAQREALARHGKDWALRLSSNNLALNLLDFLRQNA